MATKKDIDVVNSRDLVAAFTGYLIQLDLEDRRNREVECQLLTTQAESLLNHNKYRVASRKYAEALNQLVGPRLRVPLDPTNGGGVVCPVYRKFTMKECLAAMTCCNGVARCLHETKEYLDALDWTVEVDVIHKNARFVAKPIFDWEPYHPSPPCLEFHHQRLLVDVRGMFAGLRRVLEPLARIGQMVESSVTPFGGVADCRQALIPEPESASDSRWG
ncbi:hypothetical protein NUW54_g12927 [Trametes sanguinea]|uniref:Uncharacterized protein n=1 Tax=Trametes sanguinea TaxID=158606 RepID=A0ACC1MTC2_9APHY|nr:hypothetical protein NUW54_g12927 [Trametes sanguinea]